MKKYYWYKTKNSNGFNFFRENSPERERGFTLIEVLVTVAVTGILTVLASVIFINTVRNSKKAEITAEARQNAALVIDRIQKDARGASSLTTSGGGKILTIENGPDRIDWTCTAPTATANGFISREVNSSGPITVTNKDIVDGVSVSSTCTFSPAGAADLITIEFTMTEGVDVLSGPQEYQVQLPFKTSVSKRGS